MKARNMDGNNPHIELIIKHLTGNASSNEEQLLFDWLKENNENKEKFKQTRKAWEITHEKIDPEVVSINLDREWNKIEKTLGFERKSKSLQLKTARQKRSFSWVKMAAVIVLLISVGGGIFFISQQSETKMVSFNSISENELPDGSDIVLKPQSSLIYDAEYNQKNRKVKLEGEAYFEIKPDKTKPFIVEAGKLTVKVLGTSFLVKNDVYKKQFEVIVSSGRVLVYRTDNESDSIVLQAGERTALDSETIELSKSENQNQNYLSWKTKILNFDNDKLIEVVEIINDAYNSDIIIVKEELENCTLTVSFNNQSLESILIVLEATIDIKIVKKGEKISISGKGCYNEQTE